MLAVARKAVWITFVVFMTLVILNLLVSYLLAEFYYNFI